jgi:hypothetical protein
MHSVAATGRPLLLLRYQNWQDLAGSDVCTTRPPRSAKSRPRFGADPLVPCTDARVRCSSTSLGRRWRPTYYAQPSDLGRATIPGTVNVSPRPSSTASIGVLTLSVIRRYPNPAKVLKTAAVLFEYLFFDDQGLPVGLSGFPEWWSDPRTYLTALATLDLEHERPYLTQSKDFRSFILSPRDVYAEEEVYFRSVSQTQSRLSRRVRNAIDTAGRRHKPTMYGNLDIWWEEQKSMAGDWSYDFAAFNVAGDAMAGAVPLCSDFHLEVARRFENLPGAAAKPSYLELLNAHPPIDFGALQWHDIFDLRRDSRIKVFRSKLAQLAATGREDPSSIGATQWSDAFMALSTLEDSVPRALIRGVVTNLPLLIVNPLGVADAVRQVWAAKQTRRRHGWLLFLAEAHRRVKAARGPAPAH